MQFATWEGTVSLEDHHFWWQNLERGPLSFTRERMTMKLICGRGVCYSLDECTLEFFLVMLLFIKCYVHSMCFICHGELYRLLNLLGGCCVPPSLYG